MSSTSSSSTLQKIVFIQRVLKFTCTESLRVVELCQVHPTWQETIQDFSTAAIVWRDNFLGPDGSVTAARIAPDDPFAASNNNNNDNEDTDTDTDTDSTTTSTSDDGDGNQHRNRAVATRSRRARPVRPADHPYMTVAGWSVAGGGLAPADWSDAGGGLNAPQQQQQQAQAHASTEATGMNRNIQLVFFTAVAKEILWVVNQLLEARIKQEPVPTTRLSNVIKAGYYPVHVAVYNDALGSLQLLADFSKQFHADEGGFVDLYAFTRDLSPLHVAVQSHKTSVTTIKYLIEQLKFDINVRTQGARPAYLRANDDSSTKPGVTPLWMLVDSMTQRSPSSNGRSILDYLLSRDNIDIECENIDNSCFTPLEHVVRKGRDDLAKILLERGKANPNHQTSNARAIKRTCLHLCAAYEEDSHYSLTKLLIKHGANPNVQESHGFTALHVAVTYGRLELVKILLEAKSKYGGTHDADPSIVDSMGQTARDFAIARIKHDGHKLYKNIAQAIPPSHNDTKKLPGEGELPTREQYQRIFDEKVSGSTRYIRTPAHLGGRRNENSGSESD